MDSDDKKISELTQGIPVGTDIAPYVSSPASSPVTKKTLYDNGGWIGAIGTWSYSSADSPTFVISINADVTGLLSVGMRIKLTQTTVKYFIVTAIGSFGGGVTLVTVYGGTDYTLANAAITLPYYSQVKCPFGFPADPDKWTVTLSNTSNASQATPTTNIYYNVGTLSIVIPIGAWRVFFSWQAEVTVTTSALRNIGVASALSTSNNSVSDGELRASLGVTGPIGANTLRLIMAKEKIINVASKTTYYPIVLASVPTDAISTVALRGDLGNTVARAVCAYL